ncbi:alpha/beta fold hydrolase [Gemmatimonas sp. UBA7669]|uniref:alpha/beta fold hydrolase n=1 Tax=Gemmatimonas sp. UBA7669 TaxID=1946568 RepID=UPI0025C2ABD8|nr:alpha/beta hydrolase [Gemmatimonas sp. UBA7669]
MRRTLLRLAGALLGLVAVAIGGSYAWDMRQSYARIRGKSRVISTAYGDIEYATGGAGVPVLVVHGGGGGFDQGRLLVDALLGNDVRWIAPSRFGYLGSSMPDGATWDDQAAAFVALLDHLQIERVAVVALSEGGPSTLLLAAQYPERVSSLTCLSCGAVASASADHAEANKNGNTLRRVFSHDYTYWGIAKFFKPQLMRVLGASDAVVAGLTPEARGLVYRLIDEMNPAAPRSAGVVFDNTATLPGKRIASIVAPTLIVHARDDLLQLYHNAEFAAQTIPGARLMSFEAGGHVLVVVQQQAVGEAVRAQVRTGWP